MMNLANADDSFLLSSNQIPQTGCGACKSVVSQSGGKKSYSRRQKKQKTDKKVQGKGSKRSRGHGRGRGVGRTRKIKGGAYVAFDHTQTPLPMGPKGGLMTHTSGTNCGMTSDLHMGVSKQHQYGGNYSTQDYGVARYGFEEVKDMGDFRGSYAPITAIQSSQCGGKKKRGVRGGKSSKSSRSSRSSRNTRSSVKKTHKVRHNKKNKTKRRKQSLRKMKGGYHQYMSNIPHSALYGIDNSITPETSMLATPIPIQKLDTCVDNYNHYTGKGFETGVYDQAPPQ